MRASILIFIVCLLTFSGCSLFQKKASDLVEKSNSNTENNILSDLQKEELESQDEDSLYDYRLQNGTAVQDSTLANTMSKFIAISDVEKQIRETDLALQSDEERMSKIEEKELRKKKKQLQKQLKQTRKVLKQKQREMERSIEQERKIAEGDTLTFWEKQFPKKVERQINFAAVYREKPRSILIFYPWNRSQITSADKMFYAALQKPLALRGYYIPPPLLMSSFFADTNNNTRICREKDAKIYAKQMGVDAVLFVTIYRVEKEWWNTATTLNAEYLLRSAKTNDTLFFRKINYIYDTPLPPRRFKKDKKGLVLDDASQAFLNVCIAMQKVVFDDFPFGPYHKKHLQDTTDFSYGSFMRYHVDTRPE